ncbi:MAG: hypothetical protein AAB091_07545 [Elusimicrobiota bacterium]
MKKYGLTALIAAGLLLAGDDITFAKGKKSRRAETAINDVTAEIERARNERGGQKQEQTDKLFESMLHQGFLDEEWITINTGITNLLLDRDVSDHYVAGAIHRYIKLANMNTYAATFFLRTVETIARERKSRSVRRNAAVVFVNFMKFVRPGGRERGKIDYWPAISAISAMHELYDDNPDDKELRDTVRTEIMEMAIAEEESVRLYQSALNFLCSRFDSIVTLVNEERERRDLPAKQCR